MKTLAILLMICLSVNFAFSQTITSTEYGGNWDDPNTWIGGEVPGPEDNVIINGPVRLLNYDNKCLNLTVNTEKELWAGIGYYGSLKVNGNIINNGTIRGGMEISAAGNIENYGQWIEGPSGRPNIRFIAINHTIFQTPGSDFNSSFLCDDSIVNIYFNSNIHLFNENSTLGSAEIYTQGYTFKVDNGNLSGIRIVSNDTLNFNNVELSGGVEITGNYVIEGTITAYQTNILRGTVTNLGTIQSNSGPYYLTIEGNIINYGTVTISVHISGNIANNGLWASYETFFTGSNEKIISQSPAAVFEGYFQVLDSDAKITLASDVSLDVIQIILNYGTIDCGPYNLKANTNFIGGTIVSYGEITEHGSYENVLFDGNMVFHGVNKINKCIVNGDLVNFDTISQPYPISGNYLTVNGLFENLGLVNTVPILLNGDLKNSGAINTSYISVQGDSAQTITLSEPINEPVHFYSMVSGTSYQWMKNGEDIPGAIQPEILFNTLQLSDQGIYQCRVETEKETVFSREITVQLLTGIYEDKSQADFNSYRLFPNPAQNQFRVSGFRLNDNGGTIELYDLNGRKLQEKNIPVGYEEINMDVSRLQSGIYFCRLVVKDISVTMKIIIRE